MQGGAYKIDGENGALPQLPGNAAEAKAFAKFFVIILVRPYVGVSNGPACVLERLPKAVAGLVSHRTVPCDFGAEKISFNQLNKETGNRIRYRKLDAETGDEVEQSNIIKGYEGRQGPIYRAAARGA